MAIGRPISLTPNVATQNFTVTATADQTSFTVTGGYRLNELGVYRNGVRLIQGKDFTASDGSTVTLLSGAVVDDVIEFQIFDSFNIADAISSVGNQTIDGELTATAFIGDGGSLTGVGNTDNINTNNIQVSGITTLSGETKIAGIATINANGSQITGLSTFDGNIHLLDNKTLYFGGTPGTTTGDLQLFHDASHSYIRDQGTGDVRVRASGFDVRDSANALSILRANASGLMATTGISTIATAKVTDTTASTSTTTGALVVSGGVGIAGSLHVGENVSVGGTLTYEDVTNIDSVGIITARAGILVNGGRGIDIAGGGLEVAGITTLGTNVKIGSAVTFNNNSGINVTGIVTATGLNAAISVWTLGADGTDHYTFTGPGNLSTTNDPDLQLIRGQKYVFQNRSGGHPFRIQSTVNGSSGTSYSDGVTNNDAANGTDLVFDVPYDAPSVLYYQCTSHGNMGGVIYIGSSSGDNVNVGTGITMYASAGIISATTLKYGGGTNVETAIAAKASTGKAIAMAMVFG